MELISMGVEFIQSVAEYAASLKTGQVVLKQIDRALWVVEKTARWALPPSIDQEDKAQPELVRPLSWFFFLLLLITLRVVRESLSLFNLLLGKPPIRSVDVVTFIQSKRRYIRTLKYQGSRVLRARSLSGRRSIVGGAWKSRLHTLLAFTMCFRQQSQTPTGNGDELLVVKRKRNKESGPQNKAAPAQEDAMERLLEKMMVDLDADSDDDSSFTLTNATSVKSDTDITESDQETSNFDITPQSSPESPPCLIPSSTPKRSDLEVKPDELAPENEYQSTSKIPTPVPAKNNEKINSDGTDSPTIDINTDQSSKSTDALKVERNGNDSNAIDLNALEAHEESSFFEVNKTQIEICAKKESKNLIDKEKGYTQKKPSKIANGRAVESQNKRKDVTRQTRRINN